MSEDDILVLSHGKADGVSCEVRRFGATIVSWKVDGKEAIFVSSKVITGNTYVFDRLGSRYT